MELIKDRHGKTSLIITSQFPVSKWFEVMVEKTVADAILDRIIHDVHRIELKGEYRRRKAANTRSNPHFVSFAHCVEGVHAASNLAANVQVNYRCENCLRK